MRKVYKVIIAALISLCGMCIVIAVCIKLSQFVREKYLIGVLDSRDEDATCDALSALAASGSIRAYTAIIGFVSASNKPKFIEAVSRVAEAEGVTTLLHCISHDTEAFLAKINTYSDNISQMPIIVDAITSPDPFEVFDMASKILEDPEIQDHSKRIYGVCKIIDSIGVVSAPALCVNLHFVASSNIISLACLAAQMNACDEWLKILHNSEKSGSWFTRMLSMRAIAQTNNYDIDIIADGLRDKAAGVRAQAVIAAIRPQCIEALMPQLVYVLEEEHTGFIVLTAFRENLSSADALIAALIEAGKYYSRQLLSTERQDKQAAANMFIDRASDLMVEYDGELSICHMLTQDVDVWPFATEVCIRGECNTPVCVDAMCELLKKENEVPRQRALTIIGGSGKLDSEECLSMIVSLAGDSNTIIRETAMRTIGELGMQSDAITNVLIAGLRHERSSTRETAAIALRRIDTSDAEAIKALNNCLHDPEERVRKAAAKALRERG